VKIEFEDFVYLKNFATNTTYQAGKARCSINLSADGIIRSPTIVNVIGIDIHRVDLLFDLLGLDFYYFPICDFNHTIGNFNDNNFACIPHLDSNIIFNYDFIHSDLIVTADVELLTQAEVFEGFSFNDNEIINYKKMFESKYVHDTVIDEFYYVIKVLYGNGQYYKSSNNKKQYLKNIAYLLPFRHHDPNADCMIYECQKDEDLCSDICRIVSFEELVTFAVMMGDFEIPKFVNKKRSYTAVENKYVDKDEWNTVFIPKQRKVLEEEVLIIKNIKEILPLWDAKSSRFNMQSNMLVYIMNEIERQFRLDNYEVRTILTTALEFFPKLCILSLVRTNWPFNLKPEEYLILRDTKYKSVIISKAIDFLMKKDDWIGDFFSENDDVSEDEIVLINENEVIEVNLVTEENEVIEQFTSIEGENVIEN
jgi:hypothetical protein